MIRSCFRISKTLVCIVYRRAIFGYYLVTLFKKLFSVQRKCCSQKVMCTFITVSDHTFQIIF